MYPDSVAGADPGVSYLQLYRILSQRGGLYLRRTQPFEPTFPTPSTGQLGTDATVTRLRSGHSVSIRGTSSDTFGSSDGTPMPRPALADRGGRGELGQSSP